MSRDKWKLTFCVSLAVLVFGGEAVVWVHAYRTCSGHVVKNVFDWPVCIP
jgi:hypothetical protein